MLNPFICCGTLHHEDVVCNISPASTPRKSRRNNKDNKNPYSTRGLDKFSALLDDLEEKRQKIYSQMGSEDISLVRFVYSNSNDFVPVVVKVKHKNEKNNKSTKIKNKQMTQTSEVMDKKTPMESTTAVNETNQPNSEAGMKAKKKESFSWKLIRLDKLRKPSYYLPLVVVLILVFLAVFGRSAAILCTCIAWYLVPTLEDSSRRRRSLKKKNYVRRVSEKKDYVRKLSENLVSDGSSFP